MTKFYLSAIFSGTDNRILAFARELTAILQLVFVTILMLTIWPVKFFIKKNYKYCIGPIDIQSNIKYFKREMPEDVFAVNLRNFKKTKTDEISFDKTTKKATYNYWDDAGAKEYNINFQSFVLERALLGPIIFVFSLLFCRSFVYFSNSGFLISHTRLYEFWLLKCLHKKIFIIYTGCDGRSRAPSLAWAELNARDVCCMRCSLKCDTKFRKMQAEIDDYFATEIFSTIDQIGFNKSFTSFDSFSFPPVVLSEFNYNIPELKMIRIIHAASNPHLRNSKKIEEVFAKLNGTEINNRKIITETHYMIPRHELKLKMSDATIYVNSLTGVLLGAASVEAFASGCIVLSGASKDINKDLPSSLPLISVDETSLELQLRKICEMNDDELVKLMIEGRKYAEKYHSSGKVISVFEKAFCKHD